MALSDLLEGILPRRVELAIPESLSPYVGPHILRERSMPASPRELRYFGVDDDSVWDVITTKLATLRQTLSQDLGSQPGSGAQRRPRRPLLFRPS